MQYIKPSEKENAKYILYIFPSNPEQIIFFNPNGEITPTGKIMEIKSNENKIKEDLPVIPEFFKVIKTRNKENIKEALLICKDEEYVLLEQLLSVQAPKYINEEFKYQLTNIVYDYLKKYGDILKKLNPIKYGRLKNSIDSINKKEITTTINASKGKANNNVIYIFPNDLNNALRSNPRCKVIEINCQAYEIKNKFHISMERLHFLGNNEFIIVSDDFSLLKQFKNVRALDEIAIEYRRIMTSLLISESFQRRNRLIDKKELEEIIKKLKNIITIESTGQLYKSRQK